VDLDEVCVWSLHIGKAEAWTWPRLEDVLDDVERDRAARFRIQGDRRAFVAARALARHMLAHFGARDARAWRFESGACGKPRIVNAPADPRLEFNLSHTAQMVAAAVTRAGNIGIDVEAIDRVPPDPVSFADAHFAPDEAAGLRALADDRSIRERFVRLWTLKEAVVKATGRGLAQPLDGFSFLSFDPVRVVFRTADLGDPAQWAFWQQVMGTHAVAVAVRQASPGRTRFIHQARTQLSVGRARTTARDGSRHSSCCR
jgi:4'-phosphopantetheinyl transferase